GRRVRDDRGDPERRRRTVGRPLARAAAAHHGRARGVLEHEGGLGDPAEHLLDHQARPREPRLARRRRTRRPGSGTAVVPHAADTVGASASAAAPTPWSITLDDVTVRYPNGTVGLKN